MINSWTFRVRWQVQQVNGDCAQPEHAVSLPATPTFLGEDCLSEASSAAAGVVGKRVFGRNYN